MGNATFFLNQSQYNFLANKLPVPITKTKPVTPNDELLNGILFVLKTGCRWMDIPSSVCSHDYRSCWRRLRFWQQHGSLKLSWQHILLLLDREGQHHRYGTNISLLTDKQGVPLTTMTFKGNRNDIVVAAATMNKLRVGAKRRVLELNADKGYDSKAFRRHMAERGIRTNIPERKFAHRRKRGRKQRMDKVQFKFRAFVERTNAWLKSYRKLRYRYERKRGMFQAVVDLACICICLRKVKDMQ